MEWQELHNAVFYILFISHCMFLSWTHITIRLMRSYIRLYIHRISALSVCTGHWRMYIPAAFKDNVCTDKPRTRGQFCVVHGYANNTHISMLCLFYFIYKCISISHALFYLNIHYKCLFIIHILIMQTESYMANHIMLWLMSLLMNIQHLQIGQSYHCLRMLVHAYSHDISNAYFFLSSPGK